MRLQVAKWGNSADSLVEQWERNPADPPVVISASLGLEALFKTYVRAYGAMEENKIEDEGRKTRLLEKSRDVREKIRKAGA